MDFKIKRLATINDEMRNTVPASSSKQEQVLNVHRFIYVFKAAITAKFCVKVETSQSYR